MSVYKTFPNAHLIREWDKLIKLEREQVVQLYQVWEITQQDNKETHNRMIRERETKIQEAVNSMKSLGIDVYKYKNKGFTKNGFQAWFKTNVAEKITKQYPSYERGIPTAFIREMEVDGILLYNNVSPSHLVELYDRLTHQYNMKVKELRKTDRLLVKSIEYAKEHGIDIEFLPPKDIIRGVSDIAKQNYLNENVPNGTELPLKHECEFCSTYIMGEKHCSCGNRRISITVEGDLLEGFYHYTEGC